MQRCWAAGIQGLLWVAIMLAAHPHLAWASHAISGKKSWEFPWYAVAMMMVIPYIAIAYVGFRVYRQLRSRED